MEKEYKIPDHYALDIALAKLEKLKLSDFKTIQEYINQHKHEQLNTRNAKKTYDDKSLASKLKKQLCKMTY